MPHEITTTVYKFDELSDSAKERARDWWREGYDSFEPDYMYEDFERVAKILGVTFSTHAVKLMGGGTRYDSNIYWSGFSSQGDGLCFEGSYEYAKGCAKAIRAYAPQDEVLHGIADELTEVQRKHLYRLNAQISHSRSNYYHAHTMDVSVQNGDYDASDDASEAVTELMRDFADWMYRQLEKEYEYQMSDECVDENIRCNDYEFEEDGSRA